MLLPCSLGMYASAIDSLLSVLDKTIVMRRQYEEEKERYISLIKDELKQGRLTDMERYLIQNRLFAEYNSYISDSALHYINENILKSFNNINNELHETALEQLGINIIWVENYDEISDIIDRIRDI